MIQLRPYQITLIEDTRKLMRQRYLKQWQKANRVYLLAGKREWYKKNRERLRKEKRWLTPHAKMLNREACRRYRTNHPERRRRIALAWFRRNPVYANHIANFRRATKLKATPKWVDKKALESIYAKASKKKLHVDHIVPLVHPLVCGLHVPWNLQLLTPLQNFRKNNRWP